MSERVTGRTELEGGGYRESGETAYGAPVTLTIDPTNEEEFRFSISASLFGYYATFYMKSEEDARKLYEGLVAVQSYDL